MPRDRRGKDHRLRPDRHHIEVAGAGQEKTIVFGLTGTGYFDMVAYNKFNDGEMGDYIPTDEDLAKGFATIPSFPGNE